MRARFLRFSLALVLLSAVATSASAHFVFLHTVPVPGGSAVHAGFGEPGRWDRRLARNIEPTVYFVRTADGKETELRAAYNDRAECYLAMARHTAPAAVIAVCEYGVVTKAKAKPFHLTYYAMRYAAAPEGWQKLNGSPRLKVELRAAYDGKAITLTALGDGKPLANADISAWGPGGSRQLKADAQGKASWPGDGPGEYALWVGRSGEKEVGVKGKAKTMATREIATLSFALADPKAKADEPKADDKAAALLGQALRGQALWDAKFPGFTAELTADHDAGTAKGTVGVAADGAVTLSLDGDAALKRDVFRRVASMAWHRAQANVGRPGSTGGKAPEKGASVAFGGADGAATKGTSLVPIGDPFASRFWIKEGQLSAARRVMGDRRQSIRVLASDQGKSGAALPTMLTTSIWDLNHRLMESQAERRDWVTVGGYALPAKVVINRTATAKGPGADAGWETLTLTFRNHKLGGKAEAKGVTSYPGFRGDGTGRSAAKNLPLEWSPKTLAWQAKLPGYGQSAPVVHQGVIYITAIEGPNKEKNLVLAFDAASGKELWKKELPASQQVKATFAVSRAAPTPVVDDAAVYVFFESGELAALAHKDGERLWLRSLVKDYGAFKNGHGLGASLAQTAEALYVLIDHQGPSYLLSVGKKDGKNRWKEDRKSRSSWASPVVIGDPGKERLVVSSSGSVDIYECATGKRLSSYTEVGNNSVPSAVVQGDKVVIGASDPPRNPDGELTLKSCCCLTLGADGKLGERPVWASKKATASFASPLIHAGHVYYVNTVGVLYCLDLKTGEERYSQRLPGSVWASPVAAGDRVYLFGKDGVTTVVKAGPKYVKLATNRFWDAGAAPVEAKPAEKGKGTPPQFAGPAVYGTAVVDGAIYARSGTTLYAVKGK